MDVAVVVFASVCVVGALAVLAWVVWLLRSHIIDLQTKWATVAIWNWAREAEKGHGQVQFPQPPTPITHLPGIPDDLYTSPEPVVPPINAPPGVEWSK